MLRKPETHSTHQANVRGILDALRLVVRDLRVSARHAERVAGISGAQLFVLQILADVPASSVGDLTTRTMTDQSSVSVVVQRLIERKLVVRRQSADDRRRVELSVTALGRRMLARCPEPTQARLIDALQHLAPDELSALAAGMSALARAMGIDGDAPHMFFEETPSHCPPRRPRPTAAGQPR
jgi:DNA-binding MarR family transcriptional regulator